MDAGHESRGHPVGRLGRQHGEQVPRTGEGHEADGEQAADGEVVAEGRQEVLTRGIQVSGTFPALSTPKRKPKKSAKR